MKILVTGAAGFIGYFVALRLLEQGHEVVGLDIVNDYYDPALKLDRLALLKAHDRFIFVRLDIADRASMAELFGAHKFDRVIHLAAQAGVRYSLHNPSAYIDSNIVGFANILEGCRQTQVAHLVFASSSSVYGANETVPFSVHQNVDHPVSLYAATKKSNELMAHTYAHLYQLPVTGLRFFTVYGPWGRPDMALFLFTRKILAGEAIEIFNHGHHARDFTYIDDVVEGVARTMDHIATPDPDWSGAAPDPATAAAPYRLYNIGNHEPVALLDFVAILEQALGKSAQKIMLPMQPGDVEKTFADVEDLVRDVGFHPATPLETGIGKFVAWYRDYYGCSA